MIIDGELHPIERREGVTLYGRIVGPGGKLGQFEVHSDFVKPDGKVYLIYSDAKGRMNALIGLNDGGNGKAAPKPNKTFNPRRLARLG